MADGVKHEHWGSSFGFVMAAVGSAIGLGNVWRFPFITGENGGGAFVLIYLLCIALVGLPVMLAELAIGRASQGDPIKAFQHFAIRSPRLPKVASGFGLGLAAALAGSHNYGMSVLLVILSILIYHYGWSTVGFSCTLVAGLILSYYAIIGGWIFLYAWKSFAHELVFASPEEAGAYLDSVSSNGWLSSGLTLAFVLVLVLVVRSVTLPGASKGVEFFLKPDFSKINGSSILDALGHAFYSLSLGMAILITYGSYLSKKRNILKSSLWIVFFDTLIALLAGLAIFPALFAQGGNPAQGPALVFNTLPITFESIPGGLGWLWTDDLMNGTWHFGENGVEETYPELDYVISGNHGNIVSDTSGRYVRDVETGEMVFTDFPVYAYGNNHGGLAKINGRWYFFGHRQTQRTAYSRHTVAGEVQVYKDGDTPVITPFEYTSSGIAGSIPAFRTIAADRTVYLIPAADHPAPSTEKNNVHSDCKAVDPYIVATRDENAVHATYIAELRNGNIAGFKYLDFGEEETPVSVSLLLSLEENAPEGAVDVYLDAPTEEQGGTKIGSVAFSAAPAEETGTDGRGWASYASEMETPVSGIHGVYFVFRAESDEMIGAFDAFTFSK